MDLPTLEDALLAVAARVGLAVRYEPIDATLALHLHERGGLCRIDGEAVLLVDANLSRVERVAHLARALRTYDLEPISMAPAVRLVIASSSPALAIRPAPARTTRPPRLRRVR